MSERSNPQDRLPPHSPEAERGALGCMLLAPDNAKQLIGKFRTSYFYEGRNQEIFSAISRLLADEKPLDSITLHVWLRDSGRLEAAGGIDYVNSLPDETPSAANIEYYLPILRDKAHRRTCLNVSVRLSELAYDEAADPRALLHDVKAAFDHAVAKDADKREYLRFYTPSECRTYDPPEGLELVGDCHIARGNVTVLAGPPGVGKSRAALGLAVCGKTGQDWFGLKVHRNFKTAILQNENGLYRLRKEFAESGIDGLDAYVRISAPPPFGMLFENAEFRAFLAEWLAEWLPDVLVLDPWNSAARDDTQRDYHGLLQAVKSVLPKGDTEPALVIVAHTRKPKGDERRTGRGLLNEVAGSHVLISVPRSVFVMQHGTDDPEDDRIVWTCSKNNDGELGKRTAWHRRNGLFVPCTDFDWDAFDTPQGDARRTVTKQDLDALFQGGKVRLGLKHAARTLEENTGLKHSACYSALSLTGRFAQHLSQDGDGLLCWKP